MFMGIIPNFFKLPIQYIWYNKAYKIGYLGYTKNKGIHHCTPLLYNQTKPKTKTKVFKLLFLP
jgi:hypothetical protein